VFSGAVGVVNGDDLRVKVWSVVPRAIATMLLMITLS
jgi:hypothetical protein